MQTINFLFFYQFPSSVHCVSVLVVQLSRGLQPVALRSLSAQGYGRRAHCGAAGGLGAGLEARLLKEAVSGRRPSSRDSCISRPEAASEAVKRRRLPRRAAGPARPSSRRGGRGPTLSGPRFQVVRPGPAGHDLLLPPGRLDSEHGLRTGPPSATTET